MLSLVSKVYNMRCYSSIVSSARTDGRRRQFHYLASATMDTVGVLTLACGWTLGTLATGTLALVVWGRYYHRIFSIGDLMLAGAYVVTMILLALTTWAVISAGAGWRQQDVSQTQIQLFAKVRHTPNAVQLYFNPVGSL